MPAHPRSRFKGTYASVRTPSGLLGFETVPHAIYGLNELPTSEYARKLPAQVLDMGVHRPFGHNSVIVVQVFDQPGAGKDSTGMAAQGVEQPELHRGEA